MNLELNKQLYIDIVYPIGSIYMSVNSSDPSTLFGGTWVRLKDRFLLGAGDTYSAGGTGGASSVSYKPAGTVEGHAITVNEMPSHRHRQRGWWGVAGGVQPSASNFRQARAREEVSGDAWDTAMEATGGGAKHSHGFTGTQATINTMPPYLVVYMWKRTA